MFPYEIETCSLIINGILEQHKNACILKNIYLRPLKSSDSCSAYQIHLEKKIFKA